MPPDQLTVAQAAMLAGLIRSPSATAPTVHPEAAEARAGQVLDAMVETGAISAWTGGRPARLVRFRREVLLERPTPGLRLRAGRRAAG